MSKRRNRKRSVSRTEAWKVGRVRVTRNRKGRFVSWHKIRSYRHRRAARRWAAERMRVAAEKRIAVYGATVNWRGRRMRNRIEIYGRGQDLMHAILLFHHGYVPKRPYSIISADDLNDEPYEYIEGGHWVEGPEVESG
jgi:hypothetical protein